MFPYWQYLSSTRLPTGRASFIIDPRAWTNLVGQETARQLAKAALNHGHRPEQKRISGFSVQGVGNGVQDCNWEMDVPIAIPTVGGRSVLQRLRTPIVGGSGASLPGLLGLKTLEEERAILDIRN